jgi:hypothetical protein
MPVCFNDLVKLTKNLRTKFNRVSFAGIKKTSAFPVTNAFAIQGQFNSQSSEEVDHYDTVIIFHHLNFGQKKTKDLPIKIEPLDGTVLYMERPSLSDQNITATVMCTCDDYFWTWWYSNRHKARSHALGDLPKASDVTGQPVRSSDHRPYGSPPGKYRYYKGYDKNGNLVTKRREAPSGWDPRRNPVNTPGVCKHIHYLGQYLKQKKLVN